MAVTLRVSGAVRSIRAVRDFQGDAAARVDRERRLAAERDGAEIAKVVYTGAELDALLQRRPPCWRYAAFVSVLVQRRAAVESRLRDARLGYAEPTGETASTEFVTGHFFYDRLGEFSGLMGQVDSLMLSPEFSEVFGPPHDEQAADPEGIVHAAHRLMDYHDRFLELAERCRGIRVVHSGTELQRDFGLLTVLPLDGFGAFIETFIERLTEMADVVRYAPGDVVLDPVVLAVPDDEELLTRVSDRIAALLGVG